MLRVVGDQEVGDGRAAHALPPSGAHEAVAGPLGLSYFDWADGDASRGSGSRGEGAGRFPVRPGDREERTWSRGWATPRVSWSRQIEAEWPGPSRARPQTQPVPILERDHLQLTSTMTIARPSRLAYTPMLRHYIRHESTDMRSECTSGKTYPPTMPPTSAHISAPVHRNTDRFPPMEFDLQRFRRRIVSYRPQCSMTIRSLSP